MHGNFTAWTRSFGGHPDKPVAGMAIQAGLYLQERGMKHAR